MTTFDKDDLERLKRLHIHLQELFIEARKEFKFGIRDTNRGRKAQQEALRTGHSKVDFGDSAHNWTPSIAADIYPLPVLFKDPGYAKQFVILQMEVIKPTAKKLQIPLRQGIDWNRDGILTNDKWDDLPHVELHPWREWAKQSQLYEG